MRVISNPLVPRTMPVLQMRPDCDNAGLWCTPEFRASVNKWLIDMFGESEYAWQIGCELHVHPSRYKEVCANTLAHYVIKPHEHNVRLYYTSREVIWEGDA